MIILITLLTALNLALIISALVVIIITIPNWKYYKRIYKKLPTYEFKKLGDMYIANLDKRDEFIYFKDGSFLLEPGVYLHNDLITYLDLYSLYWLLKYKSYFKKLKLKQ